MTGPGQCEPSQELENFHNLFPFESVLMVGDKISTLGVLNTASLAFARHPLPDGRGPVTSVRAQEVVALYLGPDKLLH